MKMIKNLMLSLVALAIVLAAFVTAQPVAAETTLRCSNRSLNVTLSPGATETFQVIGTLCSQGPAQGKTVQLLLHGATYARYYWDFPYQAEHYSYVRSATKRDYAAFNLDRIGYGASDHPDGNLVSCSDKDAVQTYEEDFYSAAACVETVVINDAGHDLNLHMNANATYSQMLSWADRYVGSTADPAPQPCGTA